MVGYLSFGKLEAEGALVIWVDDNVPELDHNLPGVRIFEPVSEARVAVINSSNWNPRLGCAKWKDLASTALSTVPNAKKCDYSLNEHKSAKTHSSMLNDFLDEHSKTMKEAFGLSNCWHKTMLIGQTKAWTTCVKEGYEPDEFHDDQCPGAGEPRYLTVISYPHDVWDAEWGGSTEIAAQVCKQIPTVGDLKSKTEVRAGSSKVVLRVYPMPGTTLIFEGLLLHKAESPNANAGVAITDPNHFHFKDVKKGDRLSTVMQLWCHNKKKRKLD